MHVLIFLAASMYFIFSLSVCVCVCVCVCVVCVCVCVCVCVVCIYFNLKQQCIHSIHFISICAYNQSVDFPVLILACITFKNELVILFSVTKTIFIYLNT